VTHASNLSQVTAGGRPQNLDRDLPSLIVPLQHVRKPTATVWGVCWTKGQIDLEWSGKQIVLAANLVQGFQAFLSDERNAGEGIERLISELKWKYKPADTSGSGTGRTRYTMLMIV